MGGRNGVGEFDGKSCGEARGFLGVVEDEAKLASDKRLRTLLGEKKSFLDWKL